MAMEAGRSGHGRYSESGLQSTQHWEMEMHRLLYDTVECI